MKYKFILFLLFITLNVYAKSGAAILLYHHVSNTTPASTSVSIETFKKHLDYLHDNGFNVLPLNKILTTLSQGKELPAQSVAITFDDAYESILHNALPLLKEKKYPFTVFINTQSIDAGYKNYLTWDELKELQKHNALIANHTHSHLHMTRRAKNETKEAWKKRVKKDILIAKQILKEKLNVSNDLFAYPYGEYNKDVEDILKSLGYFGIAQQSGAIGLEFNKYEVPRFPMATNYSDMKRFATSVNSKQLPVKNVNIGSRELLSSNTAEYDFSFELKEGNYIKHYLACYSSSGEKLEMKVDDMKVTMSLPNWKEGRRKINCTAPSKTQKGVFYWYSQLWLVKKSDGSWYKE